MDDDRISPLLMRTIERKVNDPIDARAFEDRYGQRPADAAGERWDQDLEIWCAAMEHARSVL